MLEERNEELLYKIIDEIEDCVVSKSSNDSLIIFSLFNYCLIKKDQELFRAVVMKIESSMIKNDNFFKPLCYFLTYLSFFAKQNYEQELRRKFIEIIIGTNLRFVEFSLQLQFKTTFGDNDEYDGVQDSRITNPLYFSILDITCSNLSNVTHKYMKYLNKDMISNLFIQICSFLVTEKKDDRKLRWMRILSKFFTSMDRIQLATWMSEARLKKSNFKESRRLRRYFYADEKEEELAIQIVLKNLLNCYKAMDFSKTRFITNNLEKLLTINNEKFGGIAKENNEEKNFLACLEILITICINEKELKIVKAIENALVRVCKKYQNSFSKLLSEAEKQNRPIRLRTLTKIWKKGIEIE